MNIHLTNLIENLLFNTDFGMTPHIPNPDKELKFSFDFFMNLDTKIIIKELEKYLENDEFENAISLIHHYKGDVKFINDNISFEKYLRLKEYFDIESISYYRVKFYKNYATLITTNKYREIEQEIIDIILDKDLDLYIDISIKLNLDNIHKVFSIDKSKVFYWINNHNSKYQELKKLNQPDYIFNNMNGKLDINEETLKYFFEICPPNIEIFKDLKKSLSLETMWKFSKHKLSVEFFLEIVDTFEDLNTLINLPNIPLESLESILNKIKTKYPNIYENFNSLLVMKKEFP